MNLRAPYDLRSDRTELLLHVRPMKDTGVLFYTDSERTGDFLGLALNNGYVLYRLVPLILQYAGLLHAMGDLGNRRFQSRVQTSKSGWGLAMNQPKIDLICVIAQP